VLLGFEVRSGRDPIIGELQIQHIGGPLSLRRRHAESAGRAFWVGDCNCSLCGRLGTLWAYYPDAEVEVTGETKAYVWGDRTIGIHHCPMCGCVSHWRTLGEDFGKMGVNARLLDGFDPCGVEVRPLDNR
jgi:hypothetical protein